MNGFFAVGAAIAGSHRFDVTFLDVSGKVGISNNFIASILKC